MEQPQSLTAKLVAAWAPVTVLTEPTGATVLVDGTAQGATPATARTRRRHASHRAAPGWIQGLGDRRAGGREPAADAGSGAARPARRHAGRAHGSRGRQRQRRRRIPRSRARHARRAARRRAGAGRVTRGLRTRDHAADRGRGRATRSAVVADTDLRRGHGAGGAGVRRGVRQRPCGRQVGTSHQVAGCPHRHRSATRGIPQLSHGRHAAPWLAAGAQRAARSGAGCRPTRPRLRLPRRQAVPLQQVQRVAKRWPP